MRAFHRAQGLTLIELLVTLAISGVVLAGIVNIYAGSFSQSKLTTNLTAMQESGRFALELMARDIRMAGYSGCTTYDSADLNNDAVYQIYKPAVDNNALRGVIGMEWESSGYGSATLDPFVTDETERVGTNGGSWLSTLGVTLPSDYDEAIENSDIVQVWTAAASGIDVNNYTTSSADVTLDVDEEHGVEAGDVLMLTKCGVYIVAQVCSVSDEQLVISPGGSSTCNNDFSAPESDIALLKPAGDEKNSSSDTLEAFRFSDVTYFVGKRDDNAATPPALYRGVNGKSREMVEGIENMQMLYGVDLEHDPGALRTPDIYVPADQVDDRWGDVVAVKVTVLVRSFEKVFGESQSVSFSYNGRSDPYEPTDGYLRQVYSTTIALRNRNVGEVQGLYSETP